MIDDTMVQLAYLQPGIASFMQWSIGGSGWFFRFLNNSDAVKTSGSTAWLLSSDAALKTDIQPYTQGLDAILQIEPVTYMRKSALREGAFTTERCGISITAPANSGARCPRQSAQRSTAC